MASSGRGRPRRPPSKTTEGRENELIAKAVNLAEEQIERGTASAQVITHFLKLATIREKLEQDRLRNENELLKAKVAALASGEELKQVYEEALAAMRSYQGHPDAQEEL